MTSRNNRGFTLIELVMVIVILALLSSFALPRFADLGRDARIAVLQQTEGVLRSASSIAHAEWLVEGDSPLVITMEGVSITMSTFGVSGYPDATASGILRAAGLPEATDDEFIIEDYGPGSALIFIRLASAPNPVQCQLNYSLVSGASPVVFVTDIGC